MKIGYIRVSTQEQNTIRQESCGASGVPGSGVTMVKEKGELTAVEAMKKLNMASSTFYRKVRLNHDSVAGRTGRKAPSSGD